MSPSMLRTTSRRSAPSKLSTIPAPVTCAGGGPGGWPFTMVREALKTIDRSGRFGFGARGAASARAGDTPRPGAGAARGGGGVGLTGAVWQADNARATAHVMAVRE